MLEVTFYCDGVGRIAGLSARGHAGFAEHGEDIVCAAVSAILQAARLGLEAYLGGELEARQRSGRLELVWPARRRDFEGLRAIVTTAELGIEQIARRYPDHVRLHRRGIPRKTRGRASGRVTSMADRRRRHDV